MPSVRRCGLAALAGVVLCSCAMLALSAVPSAAADKKFAAFVERLWPEAEKLGVSRKTFDAAFEGLEPNLTLPELELPGAHPVTGTKPQAEFVRPAKEYIRESSIEKLARQGRQLAAQYQTELAEVEARYGVPGSVVLAVWARETAYGTVKLPYNAIEALATEAYLGKRKDYFREQLLWALKILEEGHVSRAAMRSSWAGAMGLTQFLPTHFRDYAQDHDGDGKRDIWTSVPDALASTAMSLKHAKIEGEDYGWQPGRTWGYEVRKPDGLDCTLEGVDNARPLREWVGLGFTRAYGRPFREDRLDDTAFLLMPEGIHGPAFLALRNYLSIKSYNFADLYVLYVGHLADRIDGGKGFETPWAISKPLPSAEVAEMQERLAALGYDVGKVDGKAGMKTRVALGTFETRAGADVDCYPSADDLELLRAQSG